MAKIKAEFHTPKFHYVIEENSIEEIIRKLNLLAKDGIQRHIVDPAKKASQKTVQKQKTEKRGYPAGTKPRFVIP
jgi:hypothetical protein